MRAVVVVEFDLPDDDPDALVKAAQSIGPRPPHAVQMHVAIQDPADAVLAVFTKENSMNTLAPYLKALVGALIAGLASLQQALDGDNNVTAQEWTGVAIALLSGLALVWAIPNKDPQARHQAESVQPPERGAVSIVTVAWIALGVAVVALLLAVGVLRV